ncbi:hypothetical protein [Bacillus salipaludis]|nr:hypothetical protein [Bacillus salipaludis]
MSDYKTLYLNQKDSVAVALSNIPEEAEVIVEQVAAKSQLKLLRLSA